MHTHKLSKAHAWTQLFNIPLPSVPDFSFVPSNSWSPSVTVTQATEQTERRWVNGQKKKGEKTKMGGCSHFYLSFVSINSIILLSLAQQLEVWRKLICFGHDTCPAKQVLYYNGLCFQACTCCVCERGTARLCMWWNISMSVHVCVRECSLNGYLKRIIVKRTI